MAEDARTPLLERLHYLAIVSSNVDELYMSYGQDAESDRLGELLERQQRCIAECLARLAEQGHRIQGWAGLDPADREALRTRFRREFFPTLTPRAITLSPGHPFPVMPALTLCLAVALQGDETGPLHFAYVRLPPALPRFVPLPGGADLVRLEEVVAANLELLYPDRQVEETALFRLTRKGDLELEEAAAGDLLQALEEELDQRAVNPVVRLEIQRTASSTLREMLAQELRFETGRGAAGLATCRAGGRGPGRPGRPPPARLVAGGGGHLPAVPPRRPLAADRPIWDQIRERRPSLHHPYDDFPPRCSACWRMRAAIPTWWRSS